MPKINVSFKEKIEEIKIYSEVIKHSDKSAFVKDALEHYLSYLQKINKTS